MTAFNYDHGAGGRQAAGGSSPVGAPLLPLCQDHSPPGSGTATLGGGRLLRLSGYQATSTATYGIWQNAFD
jgi:hypothetical protein